MADQWCPQCPNRWLARIAEGVGCEEIADELRQVGCNNWKRLEYAEKDQEGRVLEVKIVERCMRDHLPAWFNAVDHVARECAETAQMHRNVTAEGFSVLTGKPIRGDFRSLPGEVRAALTAPTKTAPSLPGAAEGGE